MKKSLLISSAIFCAIGTGAAYAQELAHAPADNSSVDTGDIIVTAQKRAESVQKVPISIAAITGKSLVEQNINSQQTLSTAVSGLHFVASGAGNSPYIRSFGNNTAQAGNEPPVTVYVDGVYVPSPSAALFSFNAVDRVEVLKGPQGTLFGRNSAAGAVQIITKTPSHNTSVDMKMGYANYQTVSGSVYGTTGLTDTIAVDLALAGSKQSKGWGRNIFDGSETYLNNNWNIRSKLLWTPTENTTITLSGDYDRTREDAGTVLAAVPGTLAPPNNAVASGGFYDTNSDVRQYRVAKQYGGYLRIEQEMPWALFTSLTSGRHLFLNGVSNTDLTPNPTTKFTYYLEETTYTQEFNLQSVTASDLKWIMGFYYYDDKSGYTPFEQRGTSSGQGANGALQFYNIQYTKSYAGYAQATSSLWTDKAHVTLGVRYTNDNREVKGANTTRNAAGAIVAATVFNSAPNGAGNLISPTIFNVPSISQNAFTYKVSVDYSFTPSTMVYASYNRGFKSGNYNLTNPSETPLKSEYVDSFEVGLKSRFLDNRVRFNLSGFYYKISDLQVRTIDPVTARPVNSNAAKARYLGLEGELDVAISDQLALNANATYVDTKYSSYKSASFLNIDANGVPISSFTGDATGNVVINTEPFSANASLRYHTDTSFGRINANANISYHSHLYYDPQNIIKRPAYTLFGTSVGWTSTNETWGIDFWARNLTNKKYSIQLQYSLAGGLMTQGTPRTYGISGRYHF